MQEQQREKKVLGEFLGERGFGLSLERESTFSQNFQSYALPDQCTLLVKFTKFVSRGNLKKKKKFN